MVTWRANGKRPGLAAAAAAGVLGLAAVLGVSGHSVAQGPADAAPPPTAPGTDRFLPRTPAWDLVGGKGRPAVPAGDAERPTAATPPAAPATPPAAPPGTGATPTGIGLALPLVPTPVISQQAGKYIKQAAGPDNVLEVAVGRLQIFNLLQQPTRIQVGDETVANYVLMPPGELSLQGLRVGTTVLNIWFNDPETNKPKLVGFLVRVLPDPDVRARLERAYRNLENEVNRAFPDSRVHLQLVGDKLTVFGQARDVAEANMIMRMVQSNVLPEAADSPDLGRPHLSDPAHYFRMVPAYHRQVVNMLRVIGEQQVSLQVQVVEVNRAAARSIGINFGIFRNNGALVGGVTTGNLGGIGLLNGFTPFGVAGAGGLGGIANIPVALDNGQIQLAIAALRNLSYARYLAEPNLVTMNGQTAQFQAGSLLPVPVVTGGAGAGLIGGLQGVNFVPLGVQLAFTPFITDRDRVRLTINAEISDRDLNVLPTLIDGAAIPSLVTRNFQTTVELREGQTLAVAGLIENKLDADSSRLPFLGMIPLLNRLGGYDRVGNREKELVILVTPRLVRPLDCKDVPPPLGSDLLEPTDFEFYVLGRLESHTGRDYRSPIRTDFSRQVQFRKMEEAMLIGPSGPSVDLPLPPDAVILPSAQPGPVPDLPAPRVVTPPPGVPLPADRPQKGGSPPALLPPVSSLPRPQAISETGPSK